MFPEQFVEQQLLSYTSPGDLVFDPFCGRGTTVFESLLKGRMAAGSDVNPVAACISSAKATAPTYQLIVARIDQLECLFQEYSEEHAGVTDFFRSALKSAPCQRSCSFEPFSVGSPILWIASLPR